VKCDNCGRPAGLAVRCRACRQASVASGNGQASKGCVLVLAVLASAAAALAPAIQHLIR